MKAPLLAAGLIFAIIAIAHLARLIYHFPIIIGTTVLPIWASVVGLIVTGGLALWMFSAACCCCKTER